MDCWVSGGKSDKRGNCGEEKRGSCGEEKRGKRGVRRSYDILWEWVEDRETTRVRVELVLCT